ncbi:MAG: DUF1622 domain-containing protein, partial [Bacteroidota bacterium]
MDFASTIAEYCATITEIAGIGVIVVFGIFSTGKAIISYFKPKKQENIFRNYRHQFGRGILLGLEFLVAADIIHTVAVNLTFKSLGVLAVVVIIRTFLSFTMIYSFAGFGYTLIVVISSTPD